MNPQDYILLELEKLKQPIKLQDIGSMPIEEALFARVMSKKFRKLKADAYVTDFVKDSIKIALTEGKPLAIGLGHGGSKPWGFEEYPEIDWAELFVLIYHVKWMRYIAEVYDKGACLELYSMDVAQERMNNLPRAETDRYTETFKQAIEFITNYLPENISITYRRWSEDFENIADYDVELDAAIEVSRKKLNGKLPELSDAQKYATEMNTRPTEEQKKDPLWREKVELIHMSVENTPTFEKYVDDRRFVPSCPTPVEGTVVVGSTKKSLAKFWFGVGALEEKAADDYNQIILTPKQMKSSKIKWENIHIDGLTSKNFNKIRIIEN